MKTELIKDILTSAPDGRPVTVCGWARTVRDSKNLVFIQVNDGSCFASIQLTFDRTNPANPQNSENIEKALKDLSTGASLKATGKLIESPASGQSVEVNLETLVVLGKCPSDYPIQKKAASMEFLRDNAHLRARTHSFRNVVFTTSILQKSPVLTAKALEKCSRLQHFQWKNSQKSQ